MVSQLGFKCELHVLSICPQIGKKGLADVREVRGESCVVSAAEIGFHILWFSIEGVLHLV